MLSEGGFQREENRSHFRAQDTNTGLFVHIRFSEKAAHINLMVPHLGIPGHRADNFAVHAAADVPDVIPDVTSRQHDGDSRNRGPDALYVRISDAVLENVTLVSFF